MANLRLTLRSRQKVLDFFKRYFKKVVITIFSALIFVITIYTLFLTVFSDIIVQNNNDFWNLPEKSLSEKETEITFKELIGKEEEHKNLYIFVLDISGSIENSRMDKAAYDKYKESVKAVNDRFGVEILALKAKAAMNIFDFAKTRLYDLLLALLQKNADGNNGEFAVWTLGDEAVKIFPDGRKTYVTENSIKKAIKEISKSISDAYSNTNFVSLFYRLKKFYERELSRKQLELHESPNFIITILSDLIHDVRGYYDARNKEIKENWEELKEEIQSICNPRIMVNMIVLPEERFGIEESIFPLFKDNIEWYRSNKTSIREKRTDAFLFPARIAKKNIIFYYENPNYISESKFILRYSRKKSGNIRLDIPSNVSGTSSQKMMLFCRKINASNEPLDSGQRIITGGSAHEVDLLINQKAMLSFSGRLQTSSSPPILRISLDNEGRTYLATIEFIKRLPGWAARTLIMLKGIFWGVFTIGLFFMLTGLSIFLFFTFGVKENEAEKSEESEFLDNSLPVQGPIEKDENDISESDSNSLNESEILSGISRLKGGQEILPDIPPSGPPIESENAMIQIFISYSHCDKEFVNRLARDLENTGMHVWLDQKKIKVGDSISKKVEEGIAGCDFFCLTISRHSVNSNWVEREYRTALSEQLSPGTTPTILPLLIQNVELPKLLTDIKYADFSVDYARGLKDLLDAVKVQ